MKENDFTRRKFISTVSAGTLGAAAFPTIINNKGFANKLAVLGGEPVRTKSFLRWPQGGLVNRERILTELQDTLWNGGRWVRNLRTDSPPYSSKVDQFEREFAKLIGVKRCVATNSGTSALHVAVEALGIGAGDEVITSPYSDYGTIQSIMCARALPVFADLDPEACGQIDPNDIEKRITENTRAIMPVHTHGVACDLASIMAIAKKHNLFLIEDACQAHLAEYQGKKLGSIGDIGCFSFNGSKCIASGEGGMVTGNNEELMVQAWAVMNKGDNETNTVRIGPKYRMHEFEGAVLMGQLPDIYDHFNLRNKNAEYLTSRISEIPGIVPQKHYEGTGKSTYWNYAMAYHKEHFNDAERSRFFKAVNAEGINLSGWVSSGFHNNKEWIDFMLNLNSYKKTYSPTRLKRYREEMYYPNCDKVSFEQSATFEGRGTLLHAKEDMGDIINAILKVYENRDQLRLI